jgi:hypothetical protein
MGKEQLPGLAPGWQVDEEPISEKKRGMAILSARRPENELHLGTAGLTILRTIFDLKTTGEESCKRVD